MKACLIVLWLAGALSAGSAVAAEPGISGTEIRLGMLNAQTGAAAGLGSGILAGAAAVFHDVNAHGGIEGRRVELIVADDAYDPEKSITETLALIEEKKVSSLFGSVGTPTTTAVIPILQESRTPLIGAFTGSMTLRQPVVHEISAGNGILISQVVPFPADRGLPVAAGCAALLRNMTLAPIFHLSISRAAFQPRPW